MQTADQHEIEGNDLAQATMSVLDRIRPHLGTILAASGVTFAGLAAWTLMSSQQESRKAAAWDACLAAISTRDAGRLGEVASRFEGTSAAVWAQILLADNALAEGGRMLLADRAGGRQRLQTAADAYKSVLDRQHPEALAAERAVFGLARANEALGEIEAARRGYETLAREYPASPLRSLAETHAASLARPSTVAWYDWFDKDAKPAATPASSPDAPAVPGAASPAG